MPTRKITTTQNALFQLHVEKTDFGSIRLRLTPKRPLRSFYGHERDVAALIYALAAELERRSKTIGASWAISPEAYDSRITIEIAREDPGLAQEFLMEVLIDLGLDSLVDK